MYKSFYNLRRNPFELTPDPFFLFSTPRHNEALATLYHGVRGHKGFVVLTGDVGTGKTLLLRCLLQLFGLSNDVIDRSTRKLTTVLVVDEAHHLSADILEEIRLLTNLETTQEKLLQVLLVGQPELNDKLDSSTLWQLKQRIAHRSQLAPLDLNETRGYIE